MKDILNTLAIWDTKCFYMWTNDKLKTDSGNSQRVDLGIWGIFFFFFFLSISNNGMWIVWKFRFALTIMY